MERLELTKDLLTGITAIDEQHRELFSRGNAVLFPEEDRMGIRDILDSLNFLIKYVNRHFFAEERLMKTYDYPRREGHEAQHLRLCRDVDKLYREARGTNSVDGMASALHYLFSDWFVYHIKEWDQHYVQFLQQHTKLGSIKIDS